MKYRHLFFDLDHTLWDFDANARLTLHELYEELKLREIGIDDFDNFHTRYLIHNELLWARYRNGTLRVDELRWKRMHLTLLDFKIGNEALAKELGTRFLDLLPTRNILFPGALEILQVLRERNYMLHIITNGFETTQHSKLKTSGLAPLFTEVITSEGSNSLKPKKEIFEYALRKAGASVEQSIMIGDNIEVDIAGAKNAGMDQVFVNHIDAETSISPTYTVRSLHELDPIFSGWH